MSSAMALPIDAISDDIVAQFPAARLVIQAPPGAGKSTRLPLTLLKSPHTGLMVMLQPRRLAAVNIAHYLAEQLGEQPGETVGYVIRGQRRRSAATRLLVVTEGVLVRWLQDDPELDGVDTVIFDEFHERNLASDLSLALLLDSLTLRPDLSLLIMSATLPAEPIQQWLEQVLSEPVKVLKSEGRQHPLVTHYRPVGRPPWQQRLVDVVREALSTAPQGILVFVPGVREIANLMQQLVNVTAEPCLPLHGQLSLAEQRQALTYNGQRRVVVATNVAETSLTIDGIDCVVDSGRERVSLYRPKYATSQLVTRFISMASATQRAGRAARLGPGQVYRLWGTADEHGFNEFSQADIATHDLTQLVAEVNAWGATVDALNWFTEPSEAHVNRAQEALAQLGVVSSTQQLTKLGNKVVAMGADIRLACIAVAAQEHSTEQRYGVAVALTCLEEPIKTLVDDDIEITLSNHLAKAPKQSRWRQRLKYWMQQLDCNRAGETLSSTSLAGLLLYGFPEYLAKRVDQQTVQLVTGVRLQADNVVSEWSLALNVRLSERESANRATWLIALRESDLHGHPILPVDEMTEVDVESGRKPALYSIKKIGALTLEKSRAAEPPSIEQIHQGLVNWLAQRGLKALNWSTDATRYWQRLYYFYKHWDDAKSAFNGIEPTPESLLINLQRWACPFWTDIRSVEDLKRWNPMIALQQLLDYGAQQQLQQLCPTTWQAPSGRRVTIDYPSLSDADQGVKPRVTLKLQEAFGEPSSPTILAGQQRLVMDLLSPAGRLLQRTEDLASFWRNAYADVSKEMRGRYPKHPWPDDPINAKATIKTNRQLR